MLDLPPIVQRYVDASTAHDLEAILACFSEHARVRDERETRRGRQAIAKWIAKTVEQYKFHYTPLWVAHHESEVILEIEVSGTFAGSPVTLDYWFSIKDGAIASLTIS